MHFTEVCEDGVSESNCLWKREDLKKEWGEVEDEAQEKDEEYEEIHEEGDDENHSVEEEEEMWFWGVEWWLGTPWDRTVSPSVRGTQCCTLNWK